MKNERVSIREMFFFSIKKYVSCDNSSFHETGVRISVTAKGKENLDEDPATKRCRIIVDSSVIKLDIREIDVS